MKKKTVVILLIFALLVSFIPAASADGVSHEGCPSACFSDVNTSLWFHEDLDFVVKNGLFYGTSPTTFGPYEAMSRGMTVSVLYRLSGSPDVSELENPFNDVAEDLWCLDAIKWAFNAGIVKGFEDGSFGADLDITRAQAAQMLFGYAKHRGLDTSAYSDFDGYEDAEIVEEWAYDAIHWVLGTGIILGTSETALSPEDPATRCQFAVILSRFMRYYEITSVDLGETDEPEDTEEPEVTEDPGITVIELPFFPVDVPLPIKPIHPVLPEEPIDDGDPADPVPIPVPVVPDVPM